MTVFTTLNRIREKSPCLDGWGKLLEHLGKTKADDEPLPLITILDSNGFDDAFWCLGAVKGHDKELRLFAVACAREVQHLMKERSIDALDVTERFTQGLASADELREAYRGANARAAHAAAHAAAYGAAYGARFAYADAYDAARAAARAKQAEIFRRIFG